MLLGSALGDLELVRVIDTVGAVSATTNLTAVHAMAKNLLLLPSAAEGINGDGYVRSQQIHLRPHSGRFRTCILRQPYLLV